MTKSISELLELAYQQGTLEQSEKEIILQIISLDRRTVQRSDEARVRRWRASPTNCQWRK